MRNDFCSNYLEHSAKGTTWKKGAKYIDRIWKNGRWFYRYRITGSGYKKDALEAGIRSKLSSGKAKELKKSGGQKYNEAARSAESYGRKAATAESNYYTKSLAGNIERGAKKIAQMLDSLKIQETVTVTSNMMPAGTKKKVK